jgi:hypothetical protein
MGLIFEVHSNEERSEIRAKEITTARTAPRLRVCLPENMQANKGNRKRAPVNRDLISQSRIASMAVRRTQRSGHIFLPVLLQRRASIQSHSLEQGLHTLFTFLSEERASESWLAFLNRRDFLFLSSPFSLSSNTFLKRFVDHGELA